MPDHRVIEGIDGQVENDGRKTVHVHHVAIALQEGRAGGQRGVRITAVAQFEKYPIDNGIWTTDRENGGRGADVVMVGPSKPAVLQHAIDCAGKGATVLLFMAPEPGVKVELDPNQLFFNEISLVSSYSCGPAETRETLQLLADKVIRKEQLITHRYPLDQTLDGCRLTAAARDSLKVVIDLP